MITQKQNIPYVNFISHVIFSAVILLLLFSLSSMNASAATITRDTDSFDDIAVAQVNSYVNVRSKASTSGKIVGKMHDNSAAVIKKTVNGEGGKWYYISSGSVKGYVKASFFVTNSTAAKVASKTGTSAAKVTASALRLRKKATTNSSTLTVLPNKTTVKLLKKNVSGSDGMTFSKVKYSQNGTSKTGYVAQDYVDFCISMKTAAAVNSSSSRKSSSAKSSSSGKNSGSTSSSRSVSGSSIAAKARTYVGVLPYVWGGTSLKSGADCSGFVQSIYKLYGVNIPRTSGSQAAGGRSISRSQLRAGDLVFYKNGGSTISHVAIYIGNGKIVHEANSRSDCKISNLHYDKPVKYVTYLH